CDRTCLYDERQVTGALASAFPGLGPETQGARARRARSADPGRLHHVPASRISLADALIVLATIDAPCTGYASRYQDEAAHKSLLHRGTSYMLNREWFAPEAGRRSSPHALRTWCQRRETSFETVARNGGDGARRVPSGAVPQSARRNPRNGNRDWRSRVVRNPLVRMMLSIKAMTIRDKGHGSG